MEKYLKETLDFLQRATDFIEHILRIFFHWLFGGSFYHFLAACVVITIVIVFIVFLVVVWIEVSNIWGKVKKFFKGGNKDQKTRSQEESIFRKIKRLLFKAPEI